MTTVTVYAGESGALTDVVFGAARELEAGGDGDIGPSPYDYLLIALGA
jgi:uncharacterized OsmC-like protein